MMEYPRALQDYREDVQSKEAAHSSLLERIVQLQEDERKNISRELHDQLGQSLSKSLLTLQGIGHLCFDGKDVTVFHVLDPGELRLPEEGLIEVEFLESRDRMNVDIIEFRDLYLQRIREYLDEIRIGCTNTGADYILVDTSTDIRDALHRRIAAK